MYFCPHPRRNFGNGRGLRSQITPLREHPQIPVQAPPPLVQPHILRHPPQAVAEIPPLPDEPNERAVNVIQLESKGKEKIEELELMPIKRAQVSEESIEPLASMEMGEGATLGKKTKKRSSMRWKITIKDFPLGAVEEP